MWGDTGSLLKGLSWTEAKIPFEEEHFKRILEKLDPIRVREHYANIMQCFNQLQVLSILKIKTKIVQLFKDGQFKLEDELFALINQSIKDKNDSRKIIQLLHLYKYLSYNKEEKAIQALPCPQLHEFVYAKCEPKAVDAAQLIRKNVQDQNLIHQLAVKLYCYALYIQSQIQQSFNQASQRVHYTLPDVPLVQRAFIEVSQIKLEPQKSDQVDEIKLSVGYKSFVQDESVVQDNLITRAFQLFDNNMYSVGKRKRSYERVKETIYANQSSKNGFEDLNRTGILFVIQPPHQNIRSDNSQHSNQDSRSFTSQLSLDGSYQQFKQKSCFNLDQSIPSGDQQEDMCRSTQSETSSMFPQILKDLSLQQQVDNSKKKPQQQLSQKALNKSYSRRSHK